jgi:hypothetical protein
MLNGKDKTDCLRDAEDFCNILSDEILSVYNFKMILKNIWEIKDIKKYQVWK